MRHPCGETLTHFIFRLRCLQVFLLMMSWRTLASFNSLATLPAGARSVRTAMARPLTRNAGAPGHEIGLSPFPFPIVLFLSTLPFASFLLSLPFRFPRVLAAMACHPVPSLFPLLLLAAIGESGRTLRRLSRFALSFSLPDKKNKFRATVCEAARPCSKIFYSLHSLLFPQSPTRPSACEAARQCSKLFCSAQLAVLTTTNLFHFSARRHKTVLEDILLLARACCSHSRQPVHLHARRHGRARSCAHKCG